MLRTHRTATLLVSMLVLSACSTAPSSDEAELIAFGPGDLPLVSRVHEYTSVSELVGDSEVVVIAHNPSPADFEMTPQGFYLVEMTIDEVLEGSALSPGETVSVVVTVSFPGEANRPLLATGRSFLLFLDRYELEAGVPLDQWVFAGYLSGVYQVVGDARFKKIDPDAPGMPEFVTREDITGSGE